MTQRQDRPMWPPAAEIAAQAFDAFDRWCRQVDRRDKDMDLYSLALAYGETVGQDHVEQKGDQP